MDDSVSVILETWHHVKTEIEELHKQRKREGTAEATKKGLELFWKFLYRSNDRPYVPMEPLPLSDFEYKPVNLKERLDFIKTRPSLYPAYIQLCELMAEQEKLYAKKKIKKASNP